ncbi:C281 [Sulfolobus spindle-shaped virus Lassen]|nr:C281 [Sulfolobus spindle-shaped virus Lassen]
MNDGKLVSVWEEEIKKAQTLEELKQKYEEAQKQIADSKTLKRLYKVYEKKQTELLLQQYRQIKAELEKRKKIKKKDKADIRVRIVKKWINSRLFTAEHYVAMLQQSKDGLQLLFLRKAKLVENQGYLMLENKKMRKSWVLNGEPLLLEKSKFPFGKKFVAVHFVLPDFPYTLNLTVDDRIRQLTLKTLNAPQIIHSIVRTKFFEALARVGGGPDLMMLIIGVVMGIGIGVAIGFGIANANLTHLLSQHVTNSTVTTTTHIPTTTTTSPSFTIPSNSSKGVS